MKKELELQFKQKVQELKEDFRDILYTLIRFTTYTVLLQWLWNNECRVLFDLSDITLLQSASLLLIVSLLKGIGSDNE